MSFNLETLIRPNIRTLEPYRCARDDFKEGILLDANENTHGPALSNISTWELALELNRYPDPHQLELKQQIANFRNSAPNQLVESSTRKIDADNLCLGVGSDESIDMLLRCVCTPGKDKLLVCPPTYGMYLICATVNDVEMVTVPLTTPDFQIDVEAILAKLSADPSIKLIYITSPGNPTAKLVDCKLIVDLLKRAQESWNGLVVVDEAYIDFVDPTAPNTSQSVSTLVNQFPNLVVLQTLSKSFGLAGVRLGITFATPGLSRFLNAMKYPYNILSLTSAVAVRSTQAEDGLKVMQGYVKKIKNERARLLETLSKIDGIGKNIGGLDANFLLIQILDSTGTPSNEVAAKLYNTLAVENGVVVRFRGKELNCTGALRLSIGTEEENATLVEKITLVLPTLR